MSTASVRNVNWNIVPGKGMVARPFDERFWEKIDQRGPNECWPWLGALNQFGYGVISMYPRNTTRVVTRVMYELKHMVKLERWQLVCHTCDRPICVNPAHLWVGSNADNQRDAAAKGRAGKTHGKRLSDEDVLEMRVLYASGKATVGELAELYSVNFQYAHAIVKGTVRRKAPVPDKGNG